MLSLIIAAALSATGAAGGVRKAEPREGGTFRIVTTAIDTSACI